MIGKQTYPPRLNALTPIEHKHWNGFLSTGRILQDKTGEREGEREGGRTKGRQSDQLHAPGFPEVMKDPSLVWRGGERWRLGGEKKRGGGEGEVRR